MIPIPNYISRQLRDHILSQCPLAQAGWEFANQDEDTLTGDFFGRMRTNWQTANDFEWRFHYNKCRGRGPGAIEKKIGADEIITLHYRSPTNGRNFYKSIVFQAKKENNPIDSKQWDKMMQFFPNGNMIISYGPNGYNSYTKGFKSSKSLCQIIATDFLDCRIGIKGLYYDHVDNKFIRPQDMPVSGTIDHELMIEVFKNS